MAAQKGAAIFRFVQIYLNMTVITWFKAGGSWCILQRSPRKNCNICLLTCRSITPCVCPPPPKDMSWSTVEKIMSISNAAGLIWNIRCWYLMFSISIPTGAMLLSWRQNSLLEEVGENLTISRLNNVGTCTLRCDSAGTVCVNYIFRWQKCSVR